jgi:hypothetical protein
MSVTFKNNPAIIDGFQYTDISKFGANYSPGDLDIKSTFIDDTLITSPSIKSYIVLFVCQFGKFKPENFFVNRILLEDETYTCFKNLPEKILKDVRTKKAKIVITIGDDGYWGSEGLPPWGEPDYTLLNLNSMMRKLKLPKGSVFFVYQNQIANEYCKNKRFNLVCIPFTEPSESYINAFNLPEKYEKKENIDKLFVCYNRKGSLSRILFISKLLKKNLLEKGNVSFLNEDNALPPQNEMYELFQSKYYSITQQEYSNFGKLTPMYLPEYDESTLKKYGLDPTQLGDYQGQVANLKNCKNTFLWIVTETNVEHNVVYFSEKTFKPIASHMPFLMISSTYTLKYLKKLGYKTFNKWWDESYDNELDLDTRLDMIIKILEDLNKKSEKELIQILEEMKPIFEHNYNHWRNRIHPKKRKENGIRNIISSINTLSLDKVLEKHTI